MTFELRKARMLQKRVDKNAIFIKKCDGYIERARANIKEDSGELQDVIKKLSKEEYLIFAYQSGFITKPDYEIMLLKLKKEMKEQ